MQEVTGSIPVCSTSFSLKPPMRLFATCAAFALWAACPASGHAAHVNVIELDNQLISSVTQQYVEGAIDPSESDGAVGLVILLDRPGGLLESTRAIVKHVLDAEVPGAD